MTQFTKAQKQEIEKLEEAMRGLGRTELTLKSYRERYNTMINSGLFNKPISKTGDNKVIEKVKQITDNLNSQQAYLNLALLLKRHVKKEESNALRLEIDKLRIKNEKVSFKKKEKLKEELPSKEYLLGKLNDLYENKKFREYIVNYLFINLNVRNLDVDAIVKRSRERKLPSRDNYLFIRKGSVKYVRNNYKTHSTYGQKINIIKDQQFINACNEYLGDKNQRFLLEQSRSNDRVTDTARTKYIQRVSIDNLGEGRIFKIVLQEHINDKNKLQKISDNRGTSINTILKEYNIDV